MTRTSPLNHKVNWGDPWTKFTQQAIRHSCSSLLFAPPQHLNVLHFLTVVGWVEIISDTLDEWHFRQRNSLPSAKISDIHLCFSWSTWKLMGGLLVQFANHVQPQLNIESQSNLRSTPQLHDFSAYFMLPFSSAGLPNGIPLPRCRELHGSHTRQRLW